MISNKKEQISQLLKSIETGDPEGASVVNEDRYVQHNPQTHEGSEGLAVLFKRLSESYPKVKIVRIFEDGDFVFAHTKYDFATRNIGFEIFRFEDGQAVEHWDNIQARKGPNSSGHSMVDGQTEATDLEMTESNRLVVQSFVEDVLIKKQLEKLDDYLATKNFIEHSPRFSDDLAELRVSLGSTVPADSVKLNYEKCHRILAEGDFVLSVCEGYVDDIHSSFFDLYRLEDGKVVEHWDTTEAIPPRSEWKNTNGKF